MKDGTRGSLRPRNVSLVKTPTESRCSYAVYPPIGFGQGRHVTHVSKEIPMIDDGQLASRTDLAINKPAGYRVIITYDVWDLQSRCR